MVITCGRVGTTLQASTQDSQSAKLEGPSQICSCARLSSASIAETCMASARGMPSGIFGGIFGPSAFKQADVLPHQIYIGIYINVFFTQLLGRKAYFRQLNYYIT
jgi:hypothetical protein